MNAQQAYKMIDNEKYDVMAELSEKTTSLMKHLKETRRHSIVVI